MKILNLKVENIKKIVAVDITPDANVMKISGKNGAGKTSVLDAIWWALGGTKTVQDQPIRDGELQASIKIDLGDLKIERKFTAKGSTLFVTDATGSKVKSPQAVLDKLLGKLTFDPLAFMRLAGKEQVSYLKELVGLDFAELDNIRQQTFDSRTEANRTLQDIDAQVAALTVHEDTPDKPVLISDLMEELKNINEQNAKTSNYVSRETAINTELNDINNEFKKMKLRINELEDEKIMIEDWRGNNSIIELGDVEQRIENVETLNGYFKAKQDRDILVGRATKGREVVQRLTDSIQAIDTDKKAQLQKAKFPIDGLAFDEAIVLFNGVPLTQASFAEQLKVSTAMAMAFNPDLRVIRITDGSMLDTDSMVVIESIAAENDFQVWIEIVDGTGDIGLYIEDGTIAADKETATEKGVAA